jgi:phosphoglucosamine mutase
MEAVPKLLAQAETELKDQGGRVLLRYSGTEPKARLLIEGRDSAIIEKWSQKISDAVKSQVGA